MSLSADQKKQVIEEYQTGADDTGSPEVQVALLSTRINELSAHFAEQQEGPSFTQGSAQDGQSASQAARLSEAR